MSSEKLIDVLTEIRDQQKQQIENFQRAIAGQSEYFALQRRGRKAFYFMVYAPWAALAAVIVYMLLMMQTLLK